jgi:mannose-1-phosphate guanylyltransferase
MNLYAVILCGGRGERFWPKSRRALPKQFISLFSRDSLTRETSTRIQPLCPPARQLFVAPAALFSSRWGATPHRPSASPPHT